LGLHLRDVDLDDVDVEELLDRLADLGLVSVLVHPEREPAVHRAVVALLGHDWGEDDLAGVHLASPRFDGRERGLAHDERASPDDGADLELRGSDDGNAREVPERLRGVDLVVGEYDDHGSLELRRLQEGPRGLRRGRVERRRVHESEGPGARVARESRAKRGLCGLLVDLEVEAARNLGEDMTAAGELRGARGAGAGAARSLLAPRLRTAARDEPAALGRERSCAL